MEIPYRVVVVSNPVSTNAAQAKRRIDEFRQLVPKERFILIETLDKGREANRKLLEKQSKLFGPDTLLCIAAGDGTVNLAAEVIIASSHHNPLASQTILLPLWGGNANDIAHMLNGSAPRTSLTKLLQRSSVVSFHPLRCILIDTKGKAQEYLAVSYIGFGASALTARRLNEPPHRNSALHNIPGGRIIKETATVVRTLFGAPAFRVKDEDRERQIYERIFINGSRIGKIQIIPLRLTDKVFYRMTVDDKRLSAAIARLRELFRKPSVEQSSERTSFYCLDEAWVQFDGEVVHLPANTFVEISHAPVMLRALSVRLGDRS